MNVRRERTIFCALEVPNKVIITRKFYPQLRASLTNVKVRNSSWVLRPLIFLSVHLEIAYLTFC